jgi:hypothetical protein
MIPTVEEWTQWVNESSAQTALTLRRHALTHFAQSLQSQAWAVLIGVADRVLAERRIQFR